MENLAEENSIAQNKDFKYCREAVMTGKYICPMMATNQWVSAELVEKCTFFIKKDKFWRLLFKSQKST